MSLLDTFTLLFRTDADDAISDTGRMADELERTERAGQDAATGIDSSSNAAVEADQSFVGLTASLGAALGAYLGWQAIGATAIQEALDVDVIGKFTDTLGFSVAEVDAWGEAAIRNGGSAEAFRGSIASLNSSLSELALTGGGDVAETLAMIGLTAVDSEGKVKGVFDLLPELADRFEGLSKQESVNLGERLGLDQGTILMLQSGRKAVEDLVERQRQLGGRTQEGYEAAATFNDALADTSRVFTGLADSGNQVLLPFFTKLLTGFQDLVLWGKEHKDFLTGFFIATAAVITAIYLPAIASAAAATLIAAAPFIAIGAAVAAAGVAFAALYEDVVAYLNGQESFIGSLGQKYEWFGKLLDATISGVKFLFGELSEFSGKMFDNMIAGAELLGNILSFVFGGIGDEFSNLGINMNVVVDGIIAAFRILGDAIAATLDFIAAPIEKSKELFNSAKEFFDSEDDEQSGDSGWFGGLFGGDDEQDIQAQTQRALQVQAEYNNNPLNAMSPAQYSQQTSQVNNSFTFGGTQIDARGMSREEAAQVVNDDMRRQVIMANGRFSDGVVG